MSLQSAQTLSRDDWHALATKVKGNLASRHFIDGEYVDSLDGGRFETVDPATGDILAAVAAGSAADIDRAVAAADRAFRDGRWSRGEPRERMKILQRFADAVEANAEELAVLDTPDMGKPIGYMVSVDIPLVAETIRFMAECIDKVEGAVTNTAPHQLGLVLRQPLGVVGAITPWNYPQLMAAWKFAPALAAGNTVVLKPAEQSPLSAPRLAELFLEAGGPPGVFNVVNGLGEQAGKALALHGDVRKVSFTGSTAVGKLIMQYAGQSNLKHVGLE